MNRRREKLAINRAAGEPCMRTSRRPFIQGALAITALLGLPRYLLALTWPKNAFTSTVPSEALVELLGTDHSEVSDKIELKLPVIAENGAEVPVTVNTSLPGVKSISIVVEKNPRPLAISFGFSPQILPEVACRLKLAKSSRVIAVVDTATGIFSTSREVTVTIGGCA
jgi:sulfur-oxidizing protein SoxY